MHEAVCLISVWQAMGTPPRNLQDSPTVKTAQESCV